MVQCHRAAPRKERGAAPGATALRQRVDGVDGRGGLGALVALRFILVLLHRVLADERAILVELAISAFAVVHQTVVAFLHIAVQRRLAALEGLVVLVAAAKGTDDPFQREGERGTRREDTGETVREGGGGAERERGEEEDKKFEKGGEEECPKEQTCRDFWVTDRETGLRHPEPDWTPASSIADRQKELMFTGVQCKLALVLSTFDTRRVSNGHIRLRSLSKLIPGLDFDLIRHVPWRGPAGLTLAHCVDGDDPELVVGVGSELQDDRVEFSGVQDRSTRGVQGQCVLLPPAQGERLVILGPGHSDGQAGVRLHLTVKVNQGAPDGRLVLRDSNNTKFDAKTSIALNAHQRRSGRGDPKKGQSRKWTSSPCLTEHADEGVGQQVAVLVGGVALVDRTAAHLHRAEDDGVTKNLGSAGDEGSAWSQGRGKKMLRDIYQ
ncbi:hypothetical protein EYF80_001448 [Liparis tanakae]|uniref:Uncharacterized protein n=1 Tax=Liparis tanakae TaxID=230148 RepID=A0A4Z2JG29_9TELE|nr:hypothetical protein EYF80_001448 [Liparis tanakae]